MSSTVSRQLATQLATSHSVDQPEAIDSVSLEAPNPLPAGSPELFEGLWADLNAYRQMRQKLESSQMPQSVHRFD